MVKFVAANFDNTEEERKHVNKRLQGRKRFTVWESVWWLRANEKDLTNSY